MGRNREQQEQVATDVLARGAAMVLGGAALALGAAGGAWIACSRWAIDHQVPLPPAIDADRRTATVAGVGELGYYVNSTGGGRPLVLIHGIDAAASAYEMRPLFDLYRGSRPVYALDLPGFGFSERTDRTYTPDLFAAAIAGFLAEEVRAKGGADVIALSLSAEFAALAALERPELVHSLVLISPTGFAARGSARDPQRASRDRGGDRSHRAFSHPLWGQALYDLLVSRPGIRYFLSRSFHGVPDRGLAEYAYATAHQPGARYAPSFFVSGELFTPDIRDRAYQRLRQPVLVLYDQDAYTRFDTLPDTLLTCSNWRATRIPRTRGLPQFEQPEAAAQAIAAFWGERVARGDRQEARSGALGKHTRWLLRRSG